MFDDKTKTEIVENIVHEVNRAYDEGYNDGIKIENKAEKEKSYEEGLRDAWNIARKLLSSTNAYIKRLNFNYDMSLTAEEVIFDYDVADVIKKIKQEEKDSKVFKVGDEVVVISYSGVKSKMYITHITHTPNGNFYSGITNEGNTISHFRPKEIYKTGKTNFKLRELLLDIDLELGG